MPVFEQDGVFGDLYVEYNVVLPPILSPTLKTSEYFPASSPFIYSSEVLLHPIELLEAFHPFKGSKDEL